MKKLNKLLALALAVILTLSLCTGVFAADKTAPLSDRTHTYTAYQIFSGTQTTTDDSEELGNIQWGDGINSASFLADLKTTGVFGTTNPFASCTNAAEVAEAMKGWDDESDNAMAFAKLAENYIITDDPETETVNEGKGIACENGSTTLDAGYYLVVDTTASVQADDAYNIALLQLTKKSTFDIVAKNSVPDVVKTVSDEGALHCTNPAEGETGHDANHVHTKECYNWSKANNVALGDTVHFKIETAVPATATEYEYYFFIVNDTLSNGLTYTADTLKVFIDGDPATAPTDYTVAINGQNIQVALVDAIGHASEEVVVTYDATLNTSAVIGVEGNKNEVTVDFSNNPNEDYGEDDIPDDGFPADETHIPNGKTPENYTLTYVSKINVYKVDENTKPLQGAEFTLYGDTLNKVLVMKEQFTKVDEGGTYYKLTNGTYTEEEPITADYMKAAEAGATEGYVVDNEYNDDDKVVIGTNTYRPYNSTTDTGKDIFVLVKANTSEYANTSEKYKCEWTSETQTADGETLKVVGTVDANGVVSFAGLPAGTYTLSETVIPNGYNPIPDIDFKLDWEAPATVTAGDEDCKWDVAEDDDSGVAYNATADAFEITIENKKGSTLPETGGIGTTIFYVIGGILLVGAAVLLITKKRMGVEA